MQHPIFFTPGPSQLFPTFRDHLQSAFENNIPSISHRGEVFHDLFYETVSSIRTVLSVPKDFHVFFVSSATEAMERTIQNSVQKQSFHLVNGAFSRLFYNISGLLGKQAEKHEVPSGEGFDCTNIDIPHNTELLCITQNETSTGVQFPPQDLYDLRRRYPQMLFALDIVSSVPCVDLDLSHFDCIFFSVQKGFGLPSGLGVLIVGPRAVEKARFLERRQENTGSFHRFTNLIAYAEKYETPETPNVLELYLLGNVARDFSRIGIKQIRDQTKQKAQFLYSFFDHHDRYTPFVTQKTVRSQTVIVVTIDGGSQHLVERLSETGFIVGKGYKEFKSTHIRIANFPAHSLLQIKRLVTQIQKCDIPTAS